MAEWYVKNKHDVDLKQKEYAKNNKEKKQNYHKDWYKKNKETVLEQSLKYHHEHKEEKSNREKKRYQENRESYLAKKRAKYIPTGRGPSTGEKKLLEICENLLQQGYIEKYEPQVTHPEVKMKLLCPFDCAIWADNNRLFFVEYHGEQHYKHVNFGGHLTEEQMQDRLIQNKWSDKNKRITCAKLGIPLLVIGNKRKWKNV